MKPGRWSQWEAQPPSPDFADRVVAAALRDRAAGPRTRRMRRSAAVLVIAALLGSAGVWAHAALRRGSAVQPPAASPAVETSAPVRDPEPARERAPAAPAPESPAIAPLPRRAIPSVPRPVAAPDAGRRLRVPMCNCTQGICDCGEEP